MILLRVRDSQNDEVEVCSLEVTSQKTTFMSYHKEDIGMGQKIDSFILPNFEYIALRTKENKFCA